MRIAKKKEVSGLADTINLELPRSWQELSERRFRYVCWLYSRGYDFDSLLAYCVVRFTHMQVVKHYDDAHWLMKQGKKRFMLLDIQMYDLCNYLRFLCTTPSKPINIPKIGRKKALPVDFRGVPFETYIIVNNLYTGYLTTQKKEILSQCAAVLYQSEKMKLDDAELQSIFFWIAGLFHVFSERFPHLFKESGGDGEQSGRNIGKMLQDVVDSQLRALTKGDITKEKEILEMDTWRALTELNALAREYEELNLKYPQK